MRRSLVILFALALVASSCGGDDGDDSTTETTTTPSSQTTGAVTVVSGLEYATYNGVPLTLDLHFPADAVNAPILVTEGFEEIERLVDEGVIVVDVSQETEPPGTPIAGPDQPMQDNRLPFRLTADMFGCAIRFAREQISDAGTDDPSVTVMSLSVGGGFFSHVALFGADLEEAWDEFAVVGGPPRQIECATTSGSTEVDGLIGVAGAYDFLVPIFEGRYGLTYQQGQDPELQAFLASAVGRNPDLMVRLFHDPTDRAIPLENSTMFEAALTEAGYDVELITFDGGHSYPQAEVILPVILELSGR